MQVLDQIDSTEKSNLLDWRRNIKNKGSDIEHRPETQFGILPIIQGANQEVYLL